MSISLSGYDFEAPGIHGLAVVKPWEVTKTIQRFFGVIGEYQLTGTRHAKEITIAVHYTGYASHTLLNADIATLATWQETKGTLTVDRGGGDSSSWTNVIFIGFMPDEPPWLDGSGVNGWQCRGTLQFRQVAS